jgi:hypothetical protein
MQPGFCHGPFALDGRRRYPDGFRCFVDAEPREKAKFDDSALSCVTRGQRIERLVEGQHIDVAGLSNWRDFIQTHHRDRSAPFVGPLAASVINEDLTHQCCRNRKEMRPVVEREAVQDHQSQINLVHESSCLESVPRAFSPDLPARYAAQLGVHQRNQPIERSSVSLPPGSQQFGDVVPARASDGISRQEG